MTDRELIRHIGRAAGQKAGYKQLVRELGLGGGRDRRELLEQLDRMAMAGELVRVDREHWMVPSAEEKRARSEVGRDVARGGASGTRDNLVAGRLDLHR